MTNTDSLMFKVKTKDIWGDITKLNFYNDDWIEQEGNEWNGEIGVFKSETGKTQSLSSWVSAPRCTPL